MSTSTIPLHFKPRYLHRLVLFLMVGVCFSILNPIYAQNHDNVWVFGNQGGVDFSGGGPTVIPPTSINTLEGSASISDATGNLLFYTDGITVWDGTHTQIATGLLGNASSSQSGVIIPRPGSADYFILTVDFRNGSNGMNYYNAVMTGGNLTSVTSPGTGGNLIANSSEKIAAFRKPCDPDTIWVVGHNFTNRQYEVFAATNTGIVPMIGPGSIIADQWASGNLSNKLGVLRFNHDGTLLASAVWLSHVELMGFNPNTGRFTATNLKFDVNTPTLTDVNAYGLEFSPDNQTLYCTITGSGSIANNQLVQFDVSNLSEPVIEGSRLLIQNFGSAANRFEAGQLTLGPDGNIYASMRRVGSPPGPAITYLGRISNPNVGGVANWNSTAVAGPAGNTTWAFYGLPNFLTEPIAVQTTTLGICTGDQVQLIPGPGSNYTWTPTTDLSCSNCPNPFADPTVTTTYTVQYTDADGNCVREEFVVEVEDCDPCETLGLQANFSYTTNSLSINVQDLSTTQTSTGVTYIEWNFGDGISGWIPDNAGTDYDYTYQQPGDYTVCVHAVTYITPEICCHDTLCIEIRVEESCDGYAADFDVTYHLSPLTADFDDITPAGSDVSLWDFGDGTQATTAGSSAPPITHTFPGPGTYGVNLIAIKHLNDTVCCIDTVKKEVVFKGSDTRVPITPSIASDDITISVQGKDGAKAEIKVFDSRGIVVYRNREVESGELQVDVSNLAAGIYYLEIRSGESVEVNKFIKQ